MPDNDRKSPKKIKRNKSLVYILETVFLLFVIAILFVIISTSESSQTVVKEEDDYGPVESYAKTQVDPVMVIDESKASDRENAGQEYVSQGGSDVTGEEEQDALSGQEADIDTGPQRILFIGDSRTIDMFADSNDELTGYDGGDDIVVYARHGYGFDYMKDVISSYGTENFDLLVTWMGANDGGEFQRYGSYYDKLLSQGVKLVVCTVGPTDDGGLVQADHPNYENSRMQAFNTELVKWAGANDVEVIDLYNYIGDSATISIDPADGIHYLPRPTTELWQYIVSRIK